MPTPNLPVRRNPNALLIICVIVTIVSLATAGWMYRQMKITERHEQETIKTFYTLSGMDQISYQFLHKELDQARETISEMSDNQQTSTQITTEGCEKPDETPWNCKPLYSVVYRNPDKGLSIELPYHPRWGAAPYESVENDLIEFGPFGLAEGGGARYNVLAFQPASSAADVLTKLARQSAIGQPPKRVTINGKTAILYTDDGEMCQSISVVVIGKKHNYVIESVCGMGGDFEELKAIAATIKFL